VLLPQGPTDCSTHSPQNSQQQPNQEDTCAGQTSYQQPYTGTDSTSADRADHAADTGQDEQGKESPQRTTQETGNQAPANTTGYYTGQESGKKRPQNGDAADQQHRYRSYDHT
jgi:hypothetical protein